jgi:hypothetical protein
LMAGKSEVKGKENIGAQEQAKLEKRIHGDRGGKSRSVKIFG